MKTLMNTVVALTLIIALSLMIAPAAYADSGATPTKTPTATPTKTPTATPTATATATPKVTVTTAPKYIEETRVECENGAYGQQTCKTVVYRKLASDEGKTHEVKKAGLEENVMMGLLALFAGSTLGYVYLKQ